MIISQISTATGRLTCEDEVDLRCARRREFVPALGAQSASLEPLFLEQPQRGRMHVTLGEAAGRKGAESTPAFPVQNGLGENRSCRIAGAQKQGVVGPAHADAAGMQHGDSVPVSALSSTLSP
jgi:hypothetical protein